MPTRPQVLEWGRYVYERAILMPAADLLPRGAALALADLAGFVDAAIPSHASRTSRAEIAAATGASGRARYLASARRLGAPRRDLVLMRRMRKRREHPRDWIVHEVGAQRVRAALAAGTSLVICTGHFMHSADEALTCSVPEIAGYSVHAPIPPRRWSPAVLRERLQNHLLYGMSMFLAGRGNRMFVPHAGTHGSVHAMVEHLSQPGQVVRVYFDAAWEKPGAYRRPFAGSKDRGFALGIARIGRLAQCPIVFAVATWEVDGSVRVEWDPWADPPPPGAGDAADAAIIDRFADALEQAVARYPLQYLHPIGADRRWEAATGRWIPTCERASQTHPSPRAPA